MVTSQKIYTFQFGLLCLSSFLFFSSFNMIIPELPAYLDRMGGGEYKGLIISLFTLTAGLSRPFSGKLADRVGRIPVMIFGAVICFICGFLYPIATSVIWFLALRFFHGLSTGFKPTGTAAYVADVIPAHRRGEAMGVLGLCGSLGMASGPAIGSTIANMYSLNVTFYISSIFAIMSVLILAGMHETLVERERFRFSLLKLDWSEVLEPRVWAPCVVTFLTTYSFGVALTLLPDLSDSLGITNRGLVFMYMTIASVVVRFFAGKASDRYGRVIVLKWAAFILVLGCLFLGFASSGFWLLAAGAFFGLALGMNTPTIYAWTIDLSHPERRGKAIATMYISLELGIGLGALTSGWIYGNNLERLPYAFVVGSVLSMAALVFMWMAKPRQVTARA
uniref:MFS transporter n=1 Tax=Roseihalotalea indica TaxID=2867963 RepID=A0AA49GQA8_9BACT|nr:MFS transporter [Tunicatimonas sp. TK19036]